MNLYLIGYRGSGKTTLAALLAKRLNWTHFDSDLLVAQLAKMPIAQIFAENGESSFRELESNVIKLAATDQNLVVSLGGGAVVEMENRDAIKSSGKTVWLRIQPTMAHQRIEADAASAEQRPALTGLSGLDEVKEMIARRTPLYEECADFTIDVDELSLEELADRIISWFKSVE